MSNGIKTIDIARLLDRWEKAMTRKDKKEVFILNEFFELIDWEQLPDALFNRYDHLISRANTLLLD